MNKSLKYVVLSGALAAVALSAPAFADAPQIVNGNFQLQTGLAANSYFTTPDGWTVLGTGVGGRDSNGGQPSPDGGKYWGIQYLQGWPELTFGNVTSLSQTISGLTVGNTYAVSFWSLVNHGYEPAVTARWAVSFGDSTQYSPLLNGQAAQTSYTPAWTSSSLNFVATSATQTLSFAAQWFGATPGVTPEVLNLDGVKLTQIAAVPEPTSLSLLLAGLTVFGFIASRRRSKA